MPRWMVPCALVIVLVVTVIAVTLSWSVPATLTSVLVLGITALVVLPYTYSTFELADWTARMVTASSYPSLTLVQVCPEGRKAHAVRNSGTVPAFYVSFGYENAPAGNLADTLPPGAMTELPQSIDDAIQAGEEVYLSWRDSLGNDASSTWRYSSHVGGWVTYRAVLEEESVPRRMKGYGMPAPPPGYLDEPR